MTTVFMYLVFWPLLMSAQATLVPPAGAVVVVGVVVGAAAGAAAGGVAGAASGAA
jgi:hypothetical protein